MLQALVAQFLESNGFNSSHRIYNTERKKRPRKEGWQDTFAKSYTADFPPLESIFAEWKNKHWKQPEASLNDDTSNISSDEEVQKNQAKKSARVSKDEVRANLHSASSSASDSSEDDSDEDTSSSESEAQAVAASSKAPATPTIVQRNSLKRKAPDSSSESTDSSASSDSSSDSESDSEADIPPVKKQRIQSPILEHNEDNESESDANSDTSSDSESLQNAIKTKLPSSGESSSTSDTSSDSGDSSASSSDDEDEKVVPTMVSLSENAASDSSGTIVGDHIRPHSSSDSSSSESADDTKQVLTSKKQHLGAHPTRLAQISAAADMDDYVSNTYVSYDYADKAFRDLSVTRGKGFTKEKNKKKRGSYRGGTIDIGGGKGFKFDD